MCWRDPMQKVGRVAESQTELFFNIIKEGKVPIDRCMQPPLRFHIPFGVERAWESQRTGPLFDGPLASVLVPLKSKTQCMKLKSNATTILPGMVPVGTRGIQLTARPWMRPHGLTFAETRSLSWWDAVLMIMQTRQERPE